MPESHAASSCKGKVVSIRGSLVDVHFPYGLPEMNNQLSAGDGGRVVLEVVAHLNSQVVRGIALTPTQGLARDYAVLEP